MKLLRTTPLLIVDAIEPLLPLWRDRLGYALLAEVPEGECLGFALLVRDDHHVMLQTAASVAKDVPAVAAEGVTHLVYNDVDALDELMAAMAGVTLLVGPRTTFYGAREVFYKIAPGQIVAYAEHAANAPH